MNISNNNRSNMRDLPNEILFIIANELNIGDVYSLIDVDERFAQIVLDPVYIRNIRNIDMTNQTMKSYFDYTFSMDDQVLSRICKQILPQIHNYVNKLTIEQNSIERILTLSYPQLYSLSLVNFQEKILLHYLTDHSILRDLLTHQITHLNIDIQIESTSQLSEITTNILELILSLTKRLTHLNFCQVFSHRKTWISINRLSHISCSLTQLKINVERFSDCLYLLDGRLDSLSKLIINVNKFSHEHEPSNIKGPIELFKLKYFSMTLNNYQLQYDERITALLIRMINLEELILFLLVTRVNSTYIDGIQLYDDFLNSMPQLKKFTFSINTGVIIENKTNHLQSNEDMQSSFIGRRYGQVGSYAFYQPMNNVGHCHVYSLPYQFDHFFNLNNSFHFQHGIFDKVRRLTMNDTRPFEHQFFKLTSSYFPFLKELIMYNYQPQKDKKHSSTLIIFPHLTFLDLFNTHIDYVVQFLLAKKTHLPCLLDLSIRYESLTMLTNNFSVGVTHLNCTQIKKLHTKGEPFARPKAFQKYFPLL